MNRTSPQRGLLVGLLALVSFASGAVALSAGKGPGAPPPLLGAAAAPAAGAAPAAAAPAAAAPVTAAAASTTAGDDRFDDGDGRTAVRAEADGDGERGRDGRGR